MRGRSTSTEHLSDGQLVQSFRDGCADAGEALIRRHWSRAWRAAHAVSGSPTAADDATQEAVAQAITHLDRFDHSRPFGPWLTRIAINRALNGRRQGRREVALTDRHTVADHLERIGERDELVAAISTLSEDHRTVVALRYWADLDPAEIAEALGVPVGTVGSRLSRALALLRAELEEVSRR